MASVLGIPSLPPGKFDWSPAHAPLESMERGMLPEQQSHVSSQQLHPRLTLMLEYLPQHHTFQEAPLNLGWQWGLCGVMK